MNKLEILEHLIKAKAAGENPIENLLTEHLKDLHTISDMLGFHGIGLQGIAIGDSKEEPHSKLYTICIILQPRTPDAVVNHITKASEVFANTVNDYMKSVDSNTEVFYENQD